MDEEQIETIRSHTDAAAGLILAVLLEKGVVTRSEMHAILGGAFDAVAATPGGELIADVFAKMKATLSHSKPSVGGLAKTGIAIQ